MADAHGDGPHATAPLRRVRTRQIRPETLTIRYYTNSTQTPTLSCGDSSSRRAIEETRARRRHHHHHHHRRETRRDGNRVARAPPLRGRATRQRPPIRRRARHYAQPLPAWLPLSACISNCLRPGIFRPVRRSVLLIF